MFGAHVGHIFIECVFVIVERPDPEVLALLDDEEFMEETQRQSTWWSGGQDGEA